MSVSSCNYMGLICMSCIRPLITYNIVASWQHYMSLLYYTNKDVLDKHKATDISDLRLEYGTQEKLVLADK